MNNAIPLKPYRVINRFTIKGCSVRPGTKLELTEGQAQAHAADLTPLLPYRVTDTCMIEGEVQPAGRRVLLPEAVAAQHSEQLQPLDA